MRLLLFVLFFLPAFAFAQQSEDSIRIENNPFTIKNLNIYEGKITPFLAPSYTPETSLLFSGGFLLTYKVQDDNPFLSRSTLPVSISYSVNNSFFLSVKPFIYGKKDKTRIYGEFWLKDMPDHYWGVGYYDGKNTNKGDSTTLYQRQWYRIFPKVVFKLKNNVYLGGVMDINGTNISDPNPRMQQDEDYLEYGEKVRNGGFGVTGAYDSRDLAVNAYKGVFLSVDMLYFTKFLGGENEFWTLEFDYRQYKKISKTKRRILAWNIKNRTNWGDVPWTDLSQIGTPFDLRGYAWGQYRDKSMLYGIFEYRHMFNRKKKNKKGSYESRSGFATWVGTGSVGSSFGQYKHWLPNYGIGYRFEVEPKMNIRIDYGRGYDSNAVYVSFTEAF